MADDTPKPKRTSKLALALVTLAIGVAGGGGAAAYWFLMHRPAQVAAPPPPPQPGIVDLDPFVVNLADPGGARFLRVSMRLLVGDEQQALEIKEDPVGKAKVRSAVLELLATQAADRLITPEGKADLKRAIAQRAQHAHHELKVSDVLFSEFVVQF